MGLWRRIGTRLGFLHAEFSESAPRPIDQIIWEMSGRGASRVSRDEALSVPAVLKGRNLICSISTLPLVLRNSTNETLRSPFLEQIDPDVPNVVTLAMTLEDLLFEGIAWWQVTARDFNNYPIAARHLDPSLVSIDPPSDGRPLNPLPAGYDPRVATVWIDGTEVPASRVIRFDSPNPAMLKVGARGIRRAILLDKAAAMYADDPRPLDYFTPTEGADPVDDKEILQILSDWKAARKKRSTGYVPAALKYNTVDAPSPADLQLAQLQKQAGLDIANELGIDPEELGISTTSRTYANAVDRRRDRINDVLSPYMRALTDRLSMGDVTRRGQTVALDLDDYLRADPLTRWQVYEIGRRLGVVGKQEIRDEERLGPMPADAAPDPEPVARKESEVDNVDASSRPSLTFADDGSGLQFADVPVTGFKVDRQRRIIEGLALPYGRTAEKYGVKFRFLKGSLKWSEPTRVKLNLHHEVRQTVGYDIRDTAAGLFMRFKVVRGAEGDKALQDAEDKILDGLSVGVAFDASNDAEMDNQGVMLVRRADLRHVALTPEPAFDDARVTKVSASRTEGSTMEECATCGQRHAPGVACPDPQPQNQPPAQNGLTLNQDQITALLARPGALDAIAQAARPQPAPQAPPAGALTLSAEQVDSLIKSGGLGVLLGVPQLTPAPRQRQGEHDGDSDGPRLVDPTRRRAATFVSEPLPYRFDRKGNLTKGSHDFSTDLVNGSRGDGEALARAQSFVAAQFKDVMAEFDVDTADVTALNPNRQRPDMYVDQKEYQYPVWSAINKGTLQDATPFTLPKFNSASGLVANHTQGVEPTPGAFTATSQTITPTAVSGKVEITREAWEQGGNPQLSGIVWRQMQRAWFEALEASAVALLDSLTPTAITLTTAATGSTLVGELEAALAALHYVRGGFRMRDFPVQVDLYKRLVDAKDADGRKLLPILSPSNADGTTASDFGAVMIGGLRGIPAWALAASGAVAASSYLFDREDVHGWATAPNRLQFEYRVAYVDVAIWGYKATANTDLTGVREVIYDPTV
jgi:Phage portal protein